MKIEDGHYTATTEKMFNDEGSYIWWRVYDPDGSTVGWGRADSTDQAEQYITETIIKDQAQMRNYIWVNGSLVLNVPK